MGVKWVVIGGMHCLVVLTLEGVEVSYSSLSSNQPPLATAAQCEHLVALALVGVEVSYSSLSSSQPPLATAAQCEHLVALTLGGVEVSYSIFDNRFGAPPAFRIPRCCWGCSLAMCVTSSV